MPTWTGEPLPPFFRISVVTLLLCLVMIMMKSILTSISLLSCSFYSYTSHFPSPAPSFLISLYPYHHHFRSIANGMERGRRKRRHNKGAMGATGGGRKGGKKGGKSANEPSHYAKRGYTMVEAVSHSLSASLCC